MKRTLSSVLASAFCVLFFGCDTGEPEPKLKAVEPPDTPVKKTDAPKDNRHKGSSGGMTKNPGADS